MNLHHFKCNTLAGEPFDFSELKGKKVMLVNVASECGLTPQYAQLQELYTEFGGEHFEIIGFPCNDFAGQEPGTADEIATFCSRNYGVTFPIMEKIHVLGEKQHPLYTWLCHSGNKHVDLEVKWNFHKFLVDEEGEFVREVDPRTSPVEPEIVEWIKK